MKNKPEDILNQVISLLAQGKSVDEIFAMFPEEKTSLSPLLQISKSLTELPHKQIPEPSKQRKYILAPQPSYWMTWIHLSKLATVSASLFLLISTFSAAAYATVKSLPGSTFFPIKKTAEHARVYLAFNDIDRASIQAQILESRLTDANTILNDPEAKTDQQKAAISELLNQTDSAIKAAGDAAKSSPSASSNQQVVASLESITKQQAQLLQRIQPQSGITATAGLALAQAQQNENKVEAIQSYIAAASKETDLANLESSTTVISLQGMVNGLDSVTHTFTINGTIAKIQDNTIFKLEDSSSTTSTIESLKNDIKITANGTTNDKGELLVKSILINSVGTSGIVKGASTEVGASNTPDKILTSQASSSPNAAEAQATASPDPNTAVGSVIFEDPSPQSSFK